MNVSGPCFVVMRNGEIFNKYEVVATQKTPLLIIAEAFYFDKEADAELYVKYLQREAGLKDINKILSSDRTFKWEKKEYEDFKDTIDWDEYRRQIKNLRFTYQKTTYKRGKK